MSGSGFLWYLKKQIAQQQGVSEVVKKVKDTTHVLEHNIVLNNLQSANQAMFCASRCLYDPCFRGQLNGNCLSPCSAAQEKQAAAHPGGLSTHSHRLVCTEGTAQGFPQLAHQPY